MSSFHYVDPGNSPFPNPPHHHYKGERRRTFDIAGGDEDHTHSLVTQRLVAGIAPSTQA